MYLYGEKCGVRNLWIIKLTFKFTWVLKSHHESISTSENNFFLWIDKDIIVKLIKGTSSDPQPHPLLPKLSSNIWEFWYQKLSHI